MRAAIPSDRVFWCVLDAPGVRAGPLPEGLGPTLEDEIPIAPELLWSVGVPVDGGRLAVGAVHRTEVESIAPGTLRLVPEAAPDFIPVQPDRFNFLIGAFEPRPVRRARLRRHATAAAAVLIGICLVALGLSRRAGAWRAEANAARQAAQTVIASMATSPGWTRDDLALELRQRKLAAPSDLTIPADAAEALAAVIARWPTHVPNKPQTISATGSAASISVTVPGDAQAFLAALQPPEGWMLDEPRLAAIDTATRLNLELRRTKGESR